MPTKATPTAKDACAPCTLMSAEKRAPRLLLQCVVVAAVVILLAAAGAVPCQGAKRRLTREHREVLERIFLTSDSISDANRHCRGQYYYRGSINLRKKNAIIVSASNRRFYMKGGRELMTEHAGDMEYYSQHGFMRKARHVYDAVPGYGVAHRYIFNFFNLSIYGVYLLRDHILSPLHRKGSHYYHYKCDSISGDTAFFSFKRKRRNMQLVDGSFAYDMEKGCVTNISFSGRYNFIAFDEKVTMGSDGEERFWPVEARLTFRYWYYGNVFEGNTIYFQNYDEIEKDFVPPVNIKNRHDITKRYALLVDTARVARDSAYMAEHRPVPLTPMEQRICNEAWTARNVTRNDTAATERSRTPKWIKNLGHIGEFFFNDYDLLTTNYSRLSVLSPSIGYSGSRGISYRQDLEYIRYMHNGRRFSIVPRAGYSFKTKELAGRIRSELLLHPVHNGMIAFEAGLQHITGNSNNLFFISETDKGEGKVESLDFLDFYTNLTANREVANGFDVSLGLVMHHRRPEGYARTHRNELELRKRYRDFAPRVTLTYTPGQDYYRAGNRKVRVESRYPKFVLNYERGIKGMFGSTNSYEKWEGMVSKGAYVTPVHRLIWKVGGGMFTNKENGDFVQYEYFNNGITAYNWDDDRSGVFQLLDPKHYNNSFHYLRGHVVVESPMLILGNFNTYILRAERLYLNGLVTEGLVPYIEFGYGISNEIMDISIFGSYIKGETIKTGVKFNLHIFD